MAVPATGFDKFLQSEGAVELVGGLIGASAGLSIGGGIGRYLDSQRTARLYRSLGAERARRARTAGSLLLGRQRAAFAASGVDPNTGTPLEVQAQSMGEAELQALDLAWQASQAAAAIKRQGRAALLQGVVGAAGQIGQGLLLLHGLKT